MIYIYRIFKKYNPNFGGIFRIVNISNIAYSIYSIDTSADSVARVMCGVRHADRGLSQLNALRQGREGSSVSKKAFKTIRHVALTGSRVKNSESGVLAELQMGSDFLGAQNHSSTRGLIYGHSGPKSKISVVLVSNNAPARVKYGALSRDDASNHAGAGTHEPQ